jgi:hypothetical protein
MPGGIGQNVMQDQHVGDHGRPGDVGHADDQHDEHFRPRQFVEIGADDDQAFDIADKDVAGHAQRGRAAQADGLLEDDPEEPDDDFQNADMP